VQKSKGLVFIYSNFRTLEGIQMLTLMFETNGYKPLSIKKGATKEELLTSVPKELHYAVYSGQEDAGLRNTTISLFTSPENKIGDYLKVLFVTSAGAEGLDLKNIRQIHILEPYWNEIRIQQLIGRGVRRNSHELLPLADRTVEVFRYLSTISTADKKDINIHEHTSTDEYIYNGALRKMKLVNETLELMREMAIDCKLNETRQGKKTKCYELVSDTDGLLYLPNLKKDLGYSPGKATKTKEVEFKLGAIDSNYNVYIIDQNRGKIINYLDVLRGHMDKGLDSKEISKRKLKLKKVWLDMDGRKVYDFIKKAETINIELGKINDDGLVVLLTNGPGGPILKVPKRA
jgi:hypothetical protein